MHYASMKQFDTANGDGIRCTLFVSGCTHHCPNCFNKEQQDFNFGEEWTLRDEERFIKMAKNPQVCGISILGGEPFDQTKDYSLFILLNRLRLEVKKPIWIWSGYTYEQLIQNPFKFAMLSECDVLIDGEFIQDLYDINLMYRGSSNQRVIDLKQTFLKNKIVYFTK